MQHWLQITSTNGKAGLKGFSWKPRWGLVAQKPWKLTSESLSFTADHHWRTWLGEMSKYYQMHSKSMIANRTVCFSADAILLWFHMTEAGSSSQALQRGSFSSGSPFLSNTLSGKRTTLMQRVKVMELGNVTDFHLYQWDHCWSMNPINTIMYFKHKGRLSFTEENNLSLNELL